MATAAATAAAAAAAAAAASLEEEARLLLPLTLVVVASAAAVLVLENKVELALVLENKAGPRRFRSGVLLLKVTSLLEHQPPTSHALPPARQLGWWRSFKPL